MRRRDSHQSRWYLSCTGAVVLCMKPFQFIWTIYSCTFVPSGSVIYCWYFALNLPSAYIFMRILRSDVATNTNDNRGYCPRSDSWSVRIYITNTRPLSREAKHMTLRIHMYVDTFTNHASEIVWDYRCNGPNKLNTLQESTSHICPWIIHAFAAPSHSLRRIRNYSNRRCALRGPVYSYGTNKTIHCSELSFMAACI